MNFHLFISHASEDKDDFVRPLTEKLKEAGIVYWFDEHSLSVGDGLRESIDQGLRNSAYGLVILSKNFFKKKWVSKELGGLFAKEISQGRRVILPVWYDISYQEIVDESPLLADVFGIQHRGDLDATVREICKVLKIHDSFNQFAGEQHVDLLTNDGSEAAWTLRRTVQVGRLPLESMNIRVSAEAHIEVASVSPGTFDRYANISGTRMAIIKYVPPFAAGAVFTQELVLRGKDMYCEDENAASIVPTLPYDSYSLSVRVPDSFAIRNVRVVKEIGGKHYDIGGLEESRDKCTYKACIKNPQVGYRHMLLWEKAI